MEKNGSKPCPTAPQCMADPARIGQRCPLTAPHCGRCTFFEPFDREPNGGLSGRCRLGIVPRFFSCTRPACPDFKLRLIPGTQPAVPHRPAGLHPSPAPAGATPPRPVLHTGTEDEEASGSGSEEERALTPAEDEGWAEADGAVGELNGTGALDHPFRASVHPSPLPITGSRGGGAGPPEADQLAAAVATILRRELGRSWAGAKRPLSPRFVGGTMVIRAEDGSEQSFPLEELHQRLCQLKGTLAGLEEALDSQEGLSREEREACTRYLRGLEGSFTTFNFLFRDKTDGFQGTGKG